MNKLIFPRNWRIIGSESWTFGEYLTLGEYSNLAIIVGGYSTLAIIVGEYSTLALAIC